MVRVTRPGGRIVVFDFDWDTLIIDHPDEETTRTVVLSCSDLMRNGWIGQQLPRLFKEQHLEVISIDPVQVFVQYAQPAPRANPGTVLQFAFAAGPATRGAFCKYIGVFCQ